MATNSLPTVPQKISFKALPGGIRAWLNSEKVIDVFLEIEDRFHITGSKVTILPIIITELVTGDLSSQEAVDDIQNSLGVSTENALTIATILKEKILNPIAIPLQGIAAIDMSGLPGAAATESMIPKEVLDEQFSVDWIEPAALAALRQSKEGERKIDQINQSTPQQKPAGMETPGLRVMKDVKAPAVAPKAEQPKPAPVPAPKIVESPRPFMLHEEKPVAPSQAATVNVNKNFSFDVGTTPISKPAPRPVTAEFNSSYDAMLGQQKPAAPIVAKTVEMPKVVHYSNLKTPLDIPKGPNE